GVRGRSPHRTFGADRFCLGRGGARGGSLIAGGTRADRAAAPAARRLARGGGWGRRGAARAPPKLSRAPHRGRGAADSRSHHRLPASARLAGRRQQLAQHHRAPNRRARRLGEEHGAGASEKSHQARRDGMGGNGRHRLLGNGRDRDPDPRRRRQSKRQQIRRYSKTYRDVIKANSIGVEFVGNYPDVAKPATRAQRQAWLMLVRFLQERYGIPTENIYAHNWIDFKDNRYCEGCELATLARKLAFQPGNRASGE